MPGIRMSDRITSKALPLASDDAFLAGGGGLDGIAGAAQHARHAVADALVVVNHEDAGHGG